MMFRSISTLLVLALVCFTGTVSIAATKELAKAIMDAVTWDNSNPNMEQRKAFALAIEAYWVEFDNRIPRLSPKEQEWVQGELSSQGDRLSRAFGTVEFAIWSLNEHTDQCLTTIRSVLESLEKVETHQFEMFYWIKMVNCYDGTNDLGVYLDKLGIPYNDKAGEGIQMHLSNIIQQTIVNRVAPMAMAETMDWSVGP